MLPKDPIMLYSAVNMKLRDSYPSLDELCATECVDKQDIIDKLRSAGFEYMPDINQFK